MNPMNGYDIQELHPDDAAHAPVTVLSTDVGKSRAVLTTVCKVRDQIVVEGEVPVMTTSQAQREICSERCAA